MLISGLHPRVSGSVDAESGLGANISSTFSVWALRLLKTAVHSVEGQEKDKAGEREVAKKKKKIYIYIYTHYTKSLPWLTHRDTENQMRQQLIMQYITMRYYYIIIVK